MTAREQSKITVERDGAGRRTVTSGSGHADPESFLQGLREDFVLVDYTKFAAFVDASALERGRSFASLVGLSKYSQLRQALEGASDTRSLNTDFDLRALETDKTAREREVTEAAARALAAYSEITGRTAADLNNVEALCATVTAALRNLELLKPIVAQNDVRKVDISAAEKLVEEAEGGPLRKQHAEVLKSLSDLKGLASDHADATERTAILGLASERDAAMAKVGGPLLRELYERANAIVSDKTWPDPKQCPVCDTKLQTTVTDHLRERIAQYAVADEANVKLEGAISKAASIARLGSLEGAAVMAVPAAERTYGSVVKAAGEHTLPTKDLEKAFARLDSL